MRVAIFFTLVLMVLHCYAFCAQRYVATTGNNANTGTITAPYKTIQYALLVAAAGDTVNIIAGTYNEKIVATLNGTAVQPIAIRNYNNGSVIIDGTGKSGNAMLQLTNPNFVSVSGLIFQNNYQQDAEGIYIVGEGQHITIDSCVVRNIGWTNNWNADPYSVNPTGQSHGVIVNGRTTTGIKNLSITHCKLYNLITGNSEALTLVGNIDTFLVAYDSVYNTRNIGIVIAGNYAWAVDAGVPAALNKARNGTVLFCTCFGNKRINNTDAPAGIYIDGAQHVNIVNCKSCNNGNGISVGCENAGGIASDIEVFGCVVYNNDNEGVVFGSNASILKNAQLVNNTIFHNGANGIWHAEIALQNSDSCSIENNIVVARTNSHYGLSIFSYTATHMQVSHNLFYRYNNDSNNIVVQSPANQFAPVASSFYNPLFVDTSAHNFSLQSTSAAIDKSKVSSPLLDTKDAGMNARIVNGLLDAGAYEHTTGGCPAILTITNAMRMQGKFTAGQKIIYNNTNATPLTQPIILAAPLIEVAQPMHNAAYMQVLPTACLP